MVQLVFFLEKVSETAPKTAISSTPAFIAYCKPYKLGTKTGYDTSKFLFIFIKTSVLSPIFMLLIYLYLIYYFNFSIKTYGIHFGETKLVASIVYNPLSLNL